VYCIDIKKKNYKENHEFYIKRNPAEAGSQESKDT